MIEIDLTIAHASFTKRGQVSVKVFLSRFEQTFDLSLHGASDSRVFRGCGAAFKTEEENLA
jgi:hypothetical protein